MASPGKILAFIDKGQYQLPYLFLNVALLCKGMSCLILDDDTKLPFTFSKIIASFRQSHNQHGA